MALIKSFNEIEDLIPSPYEQFYMSKMVRINDSKVSKKPIYAFIVDEENKKIVDYFQVEFVLFTCDVNHYLFLNDYTKELSSQSPYISVKTAEGVLVKKSDWGFKPDNLGLYVITGSRIHNKVYFGTSSNDVNEVIKSLELKQAVKKTVITSPVYV